MGYAGLQPDDPHEIGPYRLLGQLGRGGMGQVFLGMSAGGRPIAVKVIRPELAEDPEFRARFRREVAAAQKVSGLFTALVVDADLDSPVPWLATAYVAGPSLTEAVRGHGPLPVRTLLTLTAGLAEGLSAIHAAGVVHGDLKPSNVLLAEDGPRVIDFGISQAAEASSVAGSDLLIGSPAFMSPEQVLGADLSPASDMFSLGAVLAFAATGQGPFGTGSNVALMYRLVNSPATIGDVPAELRHLVGKCLAKHPGDRPTAGELLAEVGAMQPAPGWLAESIMASFSQDRSALGPSGPAGVGNLIAVTSLDSAKGAAKPRPASTAQPGKHRISRPVASACVSGGLVAASAVAVFALIGADRPTPSTHLQPQAGPGVVATAPSSASSAPASASRAPSPSASQPASIPPTAFLTPAMAGSGSVTPSLAPTPATSGGTSTSPSGGRSTSPSAKPTKSSSPSAKPTKSSSPSAKPTKSPSPSTSPSSSASSSPSGSTSSAPPSSAPPSSKPPSSAPPSSTPPSSKPPSSAPPSSTPPSSSSPTVSVSLSVSP